MKHTGILLMILFTYVAVGAKEPNKRGDNKAPIQHYTQKIKEQPNNIELYHARGTIYDDLNRFALCTKDFIQVVELYFQNPSKKHASIASDACYRLADDYLFRNSDRTRSQIYIDHGLAISEKDKRFEVLEVAILGTFPSKVDQAQRRFEKLITKHPDNEKVLLYFAKFMEKRDPRESAMLYERATFINPSNIDALFAVGSYYTNTSSEIFNSGGDSGKVIQYMEKGVSYYERIHMLKPNDNEIVEILAQFYGYLHRDKDQAKMEQRLAR